MNSFRQLIFPGIVVLATFLIYVFPYYALYALISEGRVFHWSALVVTVVFAAMIIYYFRSHSTWWPLKFFVYQGMGVGFMAFWVACFALIVRAMIPGEGVVIGLVSLAVLVLLSVIATVKGRAIKMKTLAIKTDKVSTPTKLVFISDVHLGSKPRSHLEKIRAKLDGLDFDLLLIGGDLIDSSSYDMEDLTPLKGLSQPVLFVSGNHEYYVKDHGRLLSGLSNYEVVFLDNEASVFRDLHIVGISDNQSLVAKKAAAADLIHPERFNLFMVHQPSLWDHVHDSADLMLSGHTHNGQMFPFNWLVRLQFKQVYGLYEQLGSKLYVSSGAGCWGPRMRLGTQNEIVHITISAAPTNSAAVQP